MRWRLEPRPAASWQLQLLAAAAALLLTLLISVVLFAALGYHPLEALHVYLVAPVASWYGLGELGVKAVPLLLCGLGLMFCFRAGVWNIGAEGQLVVGAALGSALAVSISPEAGPGWIIPLLLLGMLGGALWASAPALLKTRFGVNEIFSSLMLTYVAILLLSALVHGPLRDPDGNNFPHSRPMQDGIILPLILDNTRLHLGFVLALVLAGVALLVHLRHRLGFGVRLLGLAPRAASYAGFDAKRLTWGVLLASGALAGLAGIIEVIGPIGRLNTSVSPGYGFTAIIVAFLGRLHPVGVVIASFIIALSYLGGELAQIMLKIPHAVTGVFQGVLLFTLLGCDFSVRYRLRRLPPEPA